MSYQPLEFKSEFLELLNETDNVEILYSQLNLNSVERCCIDRLIIILKDLKFEKMRDFTVLDLGCSGGFFSIGLGATIAFEVTGIDDDRYITIQGEDGISSIEQTKERCKLLGIKNTSFINTSIEDFVLRNNSKEYDVIFCLNILHHFYKGYGNLTSEGKLSDDVYFQLLKKIGQINKKIMYFETDQSFFSNYDEALMEVYHLGKYNKLTAVGSSPAADGKMRILWKFQK